MVVLTSFPPPTEGVRHRESDTAAMIESQNLGKGTLYIAESRISWVGEGGEGFSLEYPAIALHAVSRDSSIFPQACLYLMIDAPLGNMEESANVEQPGDDPMSEIRFIPENDNALDTLFKAMMDCQALHPDPTDSLSDEGYTDAEEDDDEAEYDVSAAEMFFGHVENGAENGLSHLSSNRGAGDEEPMEFDEQFEDADQ